MRSTFLDFICEITQANKVFVFCEVNSYLHIGTKLLEGKKLNIVAVAQVCDSSYLADGDQQDHGLRSTQARSQQDPIATNSWA
jgi:hypothetical protein